MIYRLDGGDKPAKITFLDKYDEDGNYIKETKENNRNIHSASDSIVKVKNYNKKVNTSGIRLQKRWKIVGLLNVNNKPKIVFIK